MYPMPESEEEVRSKMSDFQKKVHIALIVKDMEMSDLIREMGVSRTFVYYCLNGKCPMPSKRVDQMCAILDISRDWLFGDGIVVLKCLQEPSGATYKQPRRNQ